MKKKLVIAAVIVVVVILLALMSIKIVPTGYSGVQITLGQVKKEPLKEGFHFMIPFINSIETVNNKQQDIVLDSTIWCESSDKVQVYMSNISVTYQISPARSAWIYANVTDYERSLLSHSIISSALKSSTIELPAEKVTSRAALEPLAREYLQNVVNEKYGEDTVLIIRVTINDMNFEDSYNTAISEKTIAQQRYETAQIENKTIIEKAEADAKASEIAAEGRANALVTEAKAQAEANRILAESITENTLKQSFYDKWDGALPRIMTGSESGPGLVTDINDIIDGE